MIRCIIISVLLAAVGAGVITEREQVFNNKDDAPAVEDETAMLQILDAMQQLMTGGSQYDREYYQGLRDCMDILDPALTNSQDCAWQGIIDYWNMGGGPHDPWGEFDLVYIEHNVTNTDFLNMTIYEPCNYASNVAYYHDTMEICNRKTMGSAFSIDDKYVCLIGSSFSGLAVSSSFLHMSHTHLGGQQDTTGMTVMAYLIHQASLSALPDASCVVTDLSYTPRSMSSIEFAEDFMTMYTLPVTEWYNHTEALDIPNYYLSFVGLTSTVFTIAFEPEFVDKLVPFIGDAFGIEPEIIDFVMEAYLPELRNLTSELDIGPVEKVKFLKNAFTVLGKILYAFLWQEEIMTDNPFFLDETVNAIGAAIMPKLNEALNEVNTFEYFEPDFQLVKNVYPGDDWCNPVIPHAKWHLETGVGLIDVVFLGDEIHRLITKFNN